MEADIYIQPRSPGVERISLHQPLGKLEKTEGVGSCLLLGVGGNQVGIGPRVFLQSGCRFL